MNREYGSVQYQDLVYQDGYGNEVAVKKPVSFITAGAWEGTIVIDILTRSLRARDDLVDLVSMCFTDISNDTLFDVGIAIKPLQIGSPSETEDRNDKLFRQSVNLEIRTEWRREVPIKNIIDTILFTATFEDLSRPAQPVANNLTINTQVDLVDILT